MFLTALVNGGVADIRSRSEGVDANLKKIEAGKNP